jgi:transmembrane sensor
VLAGGGAALAASLLGGVLWLSSGTNYRTDVGEIRRVPLADGSTVTINTASDLDVKLRKRSRDIALAAGEAWFQVAKDPHRPFVVEAGDVRVRAVGTAFSVRRVDRGAQIIVTEGVVETWAAAAEGHRAFLHAGNRAFVGDNSRIQIEQVDAGVIERALAWRSGSIELSGQSLAEAAAEFNRYNERRIVVTDPRLGGELFDGVFRTNDPQGFATSVGTSLHVRVDLSDPSAIRIGGEL